MRFAVFRLSPAFPRVLPAPVGAGTRGRIPPAREDLVRHAHHRCVAFGLFARGTGDEFGIEIVGRLEGESQQQRRPATAPARCPAACRDRPVRSCFACLAYEPADEVGRDGRGDEDDDRSRYGGRRSLHVRASPRVGAVAQCEPDAADESGQREEFADEAFAPAVEHGDGQCEPDDDVENVHWYAERVVVWDKDSASRAQNQIYLVLPRRRLSKRRLRPPQSGARRAQKQPAIGNLNLRIKIRNSVPSSRGCVRIGCCRSAGRSLRSTPTVAGFRGRRLRPARR